MTPLSRAIGYDRDGNGGTGGMETYSGPTVALVMLHETRRPPDVVPGSSPEAR